MMQSLLAKTLYDKRWFIFGWSLVVTSTVALTVLFYPALTQGNAFEELSKSVPAQLKGFVGDQASINTLAGYIAEQLYNIRIPLMLMIMALILALNLTINEEERGTLRTLSALSLSRTRILLERWVAGVVIFGAVALIAVISFWIAGFGINESVAFDFSWRIFVLSWLFGSAAFSIIYATGAASGSRGLTMGIGLFLTMGGFLLTTFGPSVDWLKNWEILSLMHYSNTSSILQGGLSSLNLWVMFLLSALFLLIAVILFRRRDIG